MPEFLYNMAERINKSVPRILIRRGKGIFFEFQDFFDSVVQSSSKARLNETLKHADSFST